MKKILVEFLNQDGQDYRNIDIFYKGGLKNYMRRNDLGVTGIVLICIFKMTTWRWEIICAY
jgi:hypothetical protein